MSGEPTGELIALTYSQGRLRGLGARLRRHGHRIVRRPLIAVELAPAPAPALAERALACPWVLFASPSAVEAWRAWGFGFGGRRLGATGPGTAQLLERLGVEVAVIGAPPDATGLTRAYLDHPLAGGPVALPRGDRALPELPRRLAAAGVSTVELLAYRTVPRPWRPRRAPSAVVLGSPSALEALPERVVRTATLVAIGPTTARAARELGGTVIEASEPTVEGVWRALMNLPTAAQHGDLR